MCFKTKTKIESVYLSMGIFLKFEHNFNAM